MDKRLPLPTGTVLQRRYRIIRQLGHGGFGAVYEALDDELNLSFALKETFYAEDEELRQAFRREARMLARLSHEAFPRVTHYFTEGDGCFLVMELIHGDDLDKLLSRRGAPFEQELVLTWADQILDALEDLHASGIVHRDIKPSNIKLTPKGRIKLLDFGIAKGETGGETTLLSTTGSMAAATLQYAPLEQVLKASPQFQMMLSVVSSDKVAEIMRERTDATSDLYALAATLYQLLTKQLPPDAPTRALSIWTGKPDPLKPVGQINPQFSNEVFKVLEKAMRLEKRARWQTAGEMREMLKNAVAPAVAPTVPAPTAASPKLPDPEPDKPEIRPLVVIPTIPAPSAKEFETPPEPSSAAKKRKIFAGVILSGFIGLFLLFAFGLGYSYIAGKIGKNNNVNAADQKQTAGNNSNSKPIASPEQSEFLKTLSGHRDRVNSVAFSPDGKTIVSGSNDETIKLWDAASGKLKQTLNGHSNMVETAAFSPDGQTIASGSRDNTIKLWDAANGLLKQTLRGHSDWVESVAFSPDGRTIASGSHDGTIRLWDAATGTLKQTLNGHSSYVNSVAFSPDGKTIVSGSSDDTTKLWDAATGTLKQTLSGNDDVVTCVAFSPDGKTIVSALYDDTIKFEHAGTTTFMQILNKENQTGSTFALSPDGKTIVTGSSDNIFKLWDVATGTLKQTFSGHSSSVYSLAFSPDGKTIASGSNDTTIKLWRVPSR
jgi:serine/threonine protein kinase